MSTTVTSEAISCYKDNHVELASISYSRETFEISFAHSSHIEGAKKLADTNRAIFGFITRGVFLDAYEAGTLIVATRYGKVVGFLRYHHRKRDLQTTLYDICVAEPERGKRLGQGMLHMLIDCCCNVGRATILLKCPSHLAANTFYEKNGFCCVETLAGKRQRLNVWCLDLTPRGHH
jgi:GNAT superfamily N-acetyltransferase